MCFYFGRSIVQPTAFRKSRDYVIYYHTWTWTIITGTLHFALANVFYFHAYLPGILPVVCLIFLKSSIYICIKRLQASLAERRHSNKEGQLNIWAERLTSILTYVGNLFAVRLKKTVEKRMAQQKRDCNLAIVLSFTVLMFLLTHAPR